MNGSVTNLSVHPDREEDSPGPEPQVVDLARSLELKAPNSSELVVVNQMSEVDLSHIWTAALNKVERAAELIHDHQSKLVAIEREAQGFFERAEQERRIFQERIVILEARLADAEQRAAQAEAETRSSRLLQWQLRNDNRDHLKRCEIAEAEVRKSSAYIRRIEELLSGI